MESTSTRSPPTSCTRAARSVVAVTTLSLVAAGAEGEKQFRRASVSQPTRNFFDRTVTTRFINPPRMDARHAPQEQTKLACGIRRGVAAIEAATHSPTAVHAVVQ